jgi:hypothetical protein
LEQPATAEVPGGAGNEFGVRGAADALRPGLPWENRGQIPLMDAYIQTLKLLFLNPSRAFELMRLRGGFQEPIFFALPGVLLSAFCASLLLWVAPPAIFKTVGATNLPVFIRPGDPLMFIVQSVLTIATWIPATFIRAGIVHVCIKFLNGARQPFEASFRVCAYVGGALCLMQIIPVCGGLIFALMAVAYEIIGFSIVHRITKTRAFFAWILPTVVCCLCSSLCVGAFMASPMSKDFMREFQKSLSIEINKNFQN